mmetsp:Transcript_52845/g.113219  ORF Transcript_52845/g.113219 Transcript_52845/m.113219 type:complete len:222 (+) Transcript_52845:1221-1886(+)
MAIRHHKKVLSSDEKVAVELRNLPATGDPNPHDRLPTHVAGEHVYELVLQLQTRVLDVELRIIPDITTSVLGERRDGSQVDVLLRRQEHLHRDLRPSQLRGKVLVPVVDRAQQLNLTVRPQESRVISRRLQAELSHTRDASPEDQQLAADVLHCHESSLDRGAHAGLIDLRLPKDRRQRVQEVQDGALALRERHQDVLSQRQEEVLEVRHYQHLRLAQVGA